MELIMQQIANIALSVSGISFFLFIVVLGLNVIFYPEESRLSEEELSQ